MNNKGQVSIWIGTGTDRIHFSQILDYKISDDKGGEFIPSKFCESIGVTSYDPDLLGGHYIPRCTEKLSLLFHGVPFLDKIIAAHPKIKPSNCYVLLYDHNYDGRVTSLELEGFQFEYIGSYTYE